ncbi:MAG: XdhC family protein [Microbacterium sp.]
MLELARDLLPLLKAGSPVAAVTVTRVVRSAPRGAGATMAVTPDGRVIGSISGGCVEGDAIALAMAVLRDGVARTARFGFDDASAHAAGLACGGSVEVVAYRLSLQDEVVRAALENVADDRPALVAVRLDGPLAGELLDLDGLRHALGGRDDVLEHAIAWRETLTTVDPGGHGILVICSAARPRLIVVGSGEHAAALCRVGAAAGYAVTVCDVWETLVTPERFPHADELVVALPHEHLRTIAADRVDSRTAICVLTHDERLDIPALHAALALPVGFVGAMGSRSTVARRTQLLREAGVAEVDLARVHSPLGLDLGGSSPDETALSVLAEIVASRHGGSGMPLRECTGAVHGRTDSGRADAEASGACTSRTTSSAKEPTGVAR